MRSILAALLLAIAPAALAQTPASAAFTYQGKLTNTSGPLSGSYDFLFRLYTASAGGTQIASTICADNLMVGDDGLFRVVLDFGLNFNGDQRWLEIDIRADSTAGNCGTGAYTRLTPRQHLTAAPLASALVIPLAQTSTTSDDAFSLSGNTRNIGTSVIYAFNDSELAETAGITGDTVGAHDTSIGVRGLTSSRGYGLYGLTFGSSTNSYGVGAIALNGTATALFARNRAVAGNGYAIRADSASSTGTAILATSTFDGIRSTVTSGSALIAERTATSGTTAAIRGTNASTAPSAIGILGEITSVSPGSYSAGVKGTSASTGFLGIGVWGQHMGGGFGVYGTASSGDGVVGSSVFGTGVRGIATAASGVTYGVYGGTTSFDGYAGFFEGRVATTSHVVRRFSGNDYRMTPIAYGVVNPGGTLASGTPNLTTSVSGTLYTIGVPGEDLHFLSTTCIVTPHSGATPSFATVNSIGGNLLIRLFNLSGTPINDEFSFVIYKR